MQKLWRLLGGKKGGPQAIFRNFSKCSKFLSATAQYLLKSEFQNVIYFLLPTLGLRDSKILNSYSFWPFCYFVFLNSFLVFTFHYTSKCTSHPWDYEATCGTGFPVLVQGSKGGVPIRTGRQSCAVFPTLCGVFPQLCVSFPSYVLSFPSYVLSFPSRVLYFPSRMLSFPSRVVFFPSCVLSFPSWVLSFPSRVLSFPNRGLSFPSRMLSFPNCGLFIPSRVLTFPSHVLNCHWWKIVSALWSGKRAE